MATRLGPHSVRFTILLGAVAALPPLAIDMSLPALRDIGHALHGSASLAGLTLGVFLAGFGAMQLVLGPLSDRIGRRPVLLGGLIAFTVGGLGCTLATGLPMLIGLRLIQGGGAAAGSVTAFAIVRDLFDGPAARRKMSVVAMLISVAPIIAPTIGVVVLDTLGWRAIYGALTVAGLILTLGVAVGLGESRPLGTPVRVMRSYARVLKHRRAGGLALANALSFGCLFAYVTGSPLIFIGRMGVSDPMFAVLFATTAGGLLAGGAIASRLAHAGGSPDVPLRWAIAGQAVTALALIAALSGPLHMAVLLPLLVANTICRGLFVPLATHAALEPMPEIAGVGSAVLGVLQMGVGALASALVAGLFPVLGPVAMGVVMAVSACAAVVVCSRAARL